MKRELPSFRRQRAIDNEAAAWVVRQERGLTAAEQDLFSEWLAKNPRHRAAFAEQRWSWEELDRLNGLQTTMAAIPDPRLLASPQRKHTCWWRVATLSMAAAVLLAFFHVVRQPGTGLIPAPTIGLCEERSLDDGSRVDLNRGASIAVTFTESERRIRLKRGEALFTVASEPGRPFVVEAAGITVSAVGTAFSVAHEPGAIAVLVTEGSVSLGTRAAGSFASTRVSAGQRAVVSLAADTPAPAVSRLNSAEIEERLAWKPRMLDFDETPLAEIAAEFSRCNPATLMIADPALCERRLSATIRSDNVEGFVALLESNFGIRADRPSTGLILLWRAD